MFFVLSVLRWDQMTICSGLKQCRQSYRSRVDDVCQAIRKLAGYGGDSSEERPRPAALTSTGSWKISYYVYLIDPITKQEKRHHRRRVIGHKSSMRKVDAEQLLIGDRERGPQLRFTLGA